MNYISKKDKIAAKDIYNDINKENNITFIANGYNNKDDFHRLFKLALLKLDENKSLKLITAVIDNLGYAPRDYKNEIIDLKFIQFLVERIDYYNNLIKSLSNKVHMEDFFASQERARKIALTENKSFENDYFPIEILRSQLAKMAESIIQSSKLERDGVITFGNRTTISEKKYFSVLTYIGFIDSLQGFLTEHLRDTYDVYMKDDFPTWLLNPPEGKNIPEFLIILKETDWRQLESYRDLNYTHIFFYEQQDRLAVLANSRSLTYNNESDAYHVDFSRWKEFTSRSQLESIKGNLQLIYGDLNAVYSIGNYNFSINQLLNLTFKIIYSVSLKDEENLLINSRFSDMCISGGIKSFSKKIGLNLLEENLLDLLCYDFDDYDRPAHSIQYSLIFKKGKVYYLVPNWVNHTSIEKIIDKLLSIKNIRLYGVKVKKGDLFEKLIINMLKEAELSVAKIKQDSRKEVPEVDGAFIYEDYFFFYEAKSSVHPNYRQEAYNYIDYVIEEAIEQLNIRKSYFEERIEDAESRLGFSIKGKKLVPMIITSSHYWTGYSALKLEDNSQVIIIDYDSFAYVMTHKKIPVWTYQESKDQFVLSFDSVSSATELFNYLTKPYSHLRGNPIPMYQASNHDIVFEIVKNFKVNLDTLKYD